MSRPLLSRMPFLGVFAGVGVGLPRFRFFSSSSFLFENIPNSIIPYNSPLPETYRFYIELPSIHSANFLESLFHEIQRLFVTHPNASFNLMVEAILPNGNRRTVGTSFLAKVGFTMRELEKLFIEKIETFEEQSGTGEASGYTESSLLRVYNISTAPQPESIPFSSASENLEWAKQTKQGQKATKRAIKTSPVLKATLEIQESLSTMSSNITKLTSVLERQVTSQVAQQPAPVTQPLLGINWTPIVQGLVTGVASSFGASVQFPTQPAAQTPGEVQVVPTSVPSTVVQTTPEPATVDLTPILSRLDKLESTVTQLTQAQSSLTSSLETLAQGLIQTNNSLNSFIEAQTKNTPSTSNGNSNDSNNGGSNSAPSTPVVNQTAPISNPKSAFLAIRREQMGLELPQALENLDGKAVELMSLRNREIYIYIKE
ncbi:truncated DNA polymerase [Rhizophagus irregularis DAOM 181602=DAOM 197198]|nr:truncated DNA polymerase [Rhizophagus irregularis DAOM 181602=DAOM 197198]